MRMTVTQRLVCSPGELTAGALRQFLDNNNIEDAAHVVVRAEYPDRPGDGGSITIEVVDESAPVPYNYQPPRFQGTVPRD